MPLCQCWCGGCDAGRGGLFVVFPKGKRYCGAWVEGWVVWCEVDDLIFYALFSVGHFEDNLVMCVAM